MYHEAAPPLHINDTLEGIPQENPGRVGDGVEKLNEQEALLVQDIVESTEVGSVGFHSSQFARLNDDEAKQWKQDIIARQEAAGIEEPHVTRGLERFIKGWGNYGERDAYSSRDPLAKSIDSLNKAANERQGYGNETLGFFELPDGRVDVRYTFKPNRGYMDDTNRDSLMQAGFILPPEAAAKLLGMVEQRPAIIEHVVKQQALSLGLPENRWRDFYAMDRRGLPMMTTERTLVVGAFGAEQDGSYSPMGEPVLLQQSQEYDGLIPVFETTPEPQVQQPAAESISASSQETSDDTDANIQDAHDLIVEDLSKLPTAQEKLASLTNTFDLWEEIHGDGTEDGAYMLPKLQEAIRPVLAGVLREMVQEDVTAKFGSLKVGDEITQYVRGATESMSIASDDPSPYNKSRLFARAYEDNALALAAKISKQDRAKLVSQHSWRLKGLDVPRNEIEAAIHTDTPIDPVNPHYAELQALHLLAHTESEED